MSFQFHQGDLGSEHGRLVTEQVAALNQVMKSHAGGIELVSMSDDGILELHFTGMCSGCPFRPLTMARTIIPALLSIEGVHEVHAPGARVSREAEERLAAAFQTS